jgi:predicted nucleic acid-binding Zn ribbon protein
VRRLAPRALRLALPGAIVNSRPATLLARVQALWPEVAGAALAASTTPVSEREGVVTVACESSLWAHELDLLQRDLVDRMNESLGGGEGAGVTRLRFKVGSLPNHP